MDDFTVVTHPKECKAPKGWVKSKFFKRKIITYRGLSYRFIAKIDRVFSFKERALRFVLAFAVTILSLGTALLCKPVRNGFIKHKESRRFAIRVALHNSPPMR